MTTGVHEPGARRPCALFAFVLPMLLLGACVSPAPPLYHWGDYQDQLYMHLKAEGSAQEQLLAMERLSVEAAGRGMAPPPGFRGHMAMLMLKLGKDGEAREMMRAEAERFPESGTFMAFLLNDGGAKADAGSRRSGTSAGAGVRPHPARPPGPSPRAASTGTPGAPRGPADPAVSGSKAGNR